MLSQVIRQQQHFMSASDWQESLELFICIDISLSWGFRGDKIQWSLGQTATSGCGTCSDILGTNTVPIVRVLLFNTRWSMLLLVCIFTLQRVYLLSVWTQDGMQAIAAGGQCWLFIEPGPFVWLVFEHVWHVCVMNIYRNCNIKGK